LLGVERRNPRSDCAPRAALGRTRDILGIWIERTEGAKFWMKVFALDHARPTMA